MEDQILDDFGMVPDIKYAKRSFWMFMGPTIFFIIMTLLLFTVPIVAWIGGGFMLIALFVFPFIGLFYFWKSHRLREPSKWYKWIGLVGNGIYIIILIAALIANMIDIYNI